MCNPSTGSPRSRNRRDQQIEFRQTRARAVRPQTGKFLLGSSHICDGRLRCESTSPIRQYPRFNFECRRGGFVNYSPGTTFLCLPHWEQFPVVDLIEGGPQGTPCRVVRLRNSDFPKVLKLPCRIGQRLRPAIEQHQPHGRRVPPGGKRFLPVFVGYRDGHPPSERGLRRPYARQSPAHRVETHGNQEMASLRPVSVCQTPFGRLGSIPNVRFTEQCSSQSAADRVEARNRLRISSVANLIGVLDALAK